jgi:hypothetical protein
MRRVCRACEQDVRDARKRDNRWATKARSTTKRHADRLGIQRDDMVVVYGWDAKRLAHEAEHAYGNGCGYCGHPYISMGHGFQDITLDVIDRSRPPYYRSNTKWCCQTCNRKKGTLSPEEFEQDRQVWELWLEQRRHSYDPVFDDEESLFNPTNAAA